MRMRSTRLGLTLVAVAAASSILLASCSSSDDAALATVSTLPTTSASASAEESASATASATPTGAAAAACAAYFDLDLLNSSYAGGAVADGDLTEAQVKEQFQAQIKELISQARLAVADGSADAKMLANAKRMKKLIRSLGKAEALSDLSKKQQTRFAKASLRVQKSCDRAGFPLPDDNVTARSAAGI